MTARQSVLPTIAATAIAVLSSMHGSPVNASVRAEAVQQLVESTSLVNVLRTDAEQASLIIDRLPEELPAELRSDLRRIIDQNLGSAEIEKALVKSLATRLDSATLDRHLRWWASGSGRAISKAESSAYASIFAGSSFDGFNRSPPAVLAPSSVAGAED